MVEGQLELDLFIEGTDPGLNARSTDPDTSRAAAGTLGRHGVKSMYIRLMRAYLRHPDGLTDEEAGSAAMLAGYGFWKRCSDLRRDGWIEPTGRTRPSRAGREQQVCRATDAGRSGLVSAFRNTPAALEAVKDESLAHLLQGHSVVESD